MTLTRTHPLPTEGRRDFLRPDQLDRLLASVTKLVINPDHGECWIATKHLEEGGYWRFHLGKKETDDGRLVSVKRAAHVVTYMHFVGPIPPGWIVDHMCSNKACCNPDHLEAIKELENLQRAHERRPWKRHNQYETDHHVQPGSDWRHQL